MTSFEFDQCTACGERIFDQDYFYWYFWVSFIGLQEEITNSPCIRCVKENFAVLNPDYDPSAMLPETHIILNEALEIGIDLRSRTKEIDDGKYVQRLATVAHSEIIKWIQSEIDIDIAENWVERFKTFDEAIKWQKCHFKSDMDPNWLSWNMEPQEIIDKVTSFDATLRPQLLEFAPSAKFQQLGIDIGPATYFSEMGLTTYDYKNFEPERCIENFILSGLKPDEIVNLMYEMRDHPQLGDVRYLDEFWDCLPDAYSRLRSQDVPITADRLVNFFNEL